MEQEYTLEALLRKFAEHAVEYGKREQMMKELYPEAKDLVPQDPFCISKALMVICQEIATLKARSGAHSTLDHSGDGNEMIDKHAKGYNELEHPWKKFLLARSEVIWWMKKRKNRSDAEIAETLSMDEMQVVLIIQDIEKAMENQ